MRPCGRMLATSQLSHFLFIYDDIILLMTAASVFRKFFDSRFLLTTGFMLATASVSLFVARIVPGGRSPSGKRARARGSGNVGGGSAVH